MELKEIMRMQLEFDKRHASNFTWSQNINNENLEMLGFLIIAITGEIGELSNVVKKILRGDKEFSLEINRDELEEEITDIFIYLMKICNQMDIDLEENFLKKLQKNIEEFRKYETN
jgi:NTP pyrophosphatase (non-canonical NTP hydrolase)